MFIFNFLPCLADDDKSHLPSANSIQKSTLIMSKWPQERNSTRGQLFISKILKGRKERQNTNCAFRSIAFSFFFLPLHRLPPVAQLFKRFLELWFALNTTVKKNRLAEDEFSPNINYFSPSLGGFFFIFILSASPEEKAPKSLILVIFFTPTARGWRSYWKVTSDDGNSIEIPPWPVHSVQNMTRYIHTL